MSTFLEGIVQLSESFPEELERELYARVRYASRDIQSAHIAGISRNRIVFTVSPAERSDTGFIVHALGEIAAELLRGFRPHPPRVLSTRPWNGQENFADPHLDLLQRGELIAYGPGRYGLGNGLAILLEAVDRLIVELGAKLKPRTYQFPALIGCDVLAKADYPRAFPHLITVASYVREDLAALRAFRDHAKGSDWQDVQDFLAPPECGLSPTVCYHAYEMWSRAPQQHPQVMTARGKCFRYESSGLQGLERLWDFTMREIVFLNDSTQVSATTEAMVQLWIELLNVLELSYEISSATDPFFVDEFAVQATYQQAFESKFEILADLPYRDKRIAIGSINLHRDHFVRAFAILPDDAAGLQTSCVGFGLERIVLAFLAQHGLNPSGWPTRLVEFGAALA